MSVLGNRIKMLRQNLGLSREDLSRKLGVSYSAVAMYEQGNREPNSEIIIKLCEIFNCSIDYLIGRDIYKKNKHPYSAIYDFSTNNDRNILSNAITYAIQNNLDTANEIRHNTKIESYLNRLEKLNTNQALVFIQEIAIRFKGKNDFNLDEFISSLRYQSSISSNLHMCPVYGQISAGQPNWAEECLEGYLPIDPNLMGIISPEQCFFLRVKGESMNQLIKNGAYALIRRQDVVENGEIAVVLVNGDEATLKKFTQHGDVIVLEPMSDDPNFKTQIYDKNTRIQILGKYIGKFEMKK